MKTDYAWRFTTMLVVVCLMAAAVLTSCGGGGNAGLDNVNTPSAGTDQKGSGLLTITEDEVGTLAGWQQDLLADAGWNQPPIAQRADTPMPAPSYEMLLQWQEQAQADGITMAPRGADGKGASWTAGKAQNPSQTIQKGMYNTPFANAVTFGCKAATGIGSPPMSKERNIAAQPLPTGATQALSFVERGASSTNHFNVSGGGVLNNLAAVYQIFASSSTADPTKPYSFYTPPTIPPTFAEISYRADGGPGKTGPCDASVLAYTVRDFMWWKYNSTINALPGQASTALYNILIAPSSNESAAGTSVGNTVGRWQSFYMGSLTAQYGGAWIVSLESSTSTCSQFASTIPSSRLFYTNPIYGVLLQRWQDSVLESMQSPNDVPWKGEFGWPVQGPTAYNGGAQTLTGNGVYYAWGMYFERGFFWWIDYVNNTNVPDEAQAYKFSGGNVFCKGQNDKYEKLPTIFYGGGGATPGVSVVVEASLNPDRGPGSPPAGTFYEVANTATPLLLDMHAHGYNGSPRADGKYKHYTWAFRDGTIGVTNGTAFDDSTKYVQHAYAEQSVYTVRVQVVDNANAVGYGDSLPIHVGQGGASGAGQVWLIRMDGGSFNNNAQALKDAMDSIGVTYSEVTFDPLTTATDFINSAASKVAIFYRGGPGGAGETTPQTSAMTQAQYDAMRTILNSGSKRKVLFVSQNHATANASSDHYYKPFEFEGPGYFYYYPVAKAFSGTYTTHAPTADYTELEEKIDGQSAFPLQSYSSGGNYYQGFYNYLDPGIYNMYAFCSMRSGSYTSPIPFMRFGNYSSNAAEKYSGAGSSLKIPSSLSISANKQWNQRGYWTFSQSPYTARNTGFTPGMGVELSNSQLTQFGDQCLVSYGNSTGPGLTAGTGKYWVWGFSFADLAINSPAGMTKGELLRNTLAWLDSSLTFSAKTNGGFQEYQGDPQIVSVTPAFWDEPNHMYRTGGPTAPWNGSAGNFPDQTSTNAYRNTVGAQGNVIITSDPNNNWLNGNDVDFQHPFYAYINRGSGSPPAVEIGGTQANNWNSTNDTIFYNGLLVNDPDGSWQRFTPAGTPSIQLKEEFNNTASRNPIPVVAGFYQDTGVGSTADDEYSNYGTELDAFSAASVTWNNNDPLHVETIARWPQSLKYFNWTGPGGLAPNAPDAYLAWTVYPGQGARIPQGPNVGKFIGINANWEEYLRNFDIDPSFSVPARTNTNAWNRPAFSHKDDPSQGRVINFNFRKIPTWNPDLNRDGSTTNADKFPVRCRIFTDHKTYYDKVVGAGALNTGWPNHLANPGGDPATVAPPLRNPSFIEGGAYVRDTGTAVYPMQVIDDPSANDPHLTISGSPGAYTATVNFIIKYGSPNYKIDVDTYYSGTFGPGPNGNNSLPVDLVALKSYAQSPNTNGVKSYTFNVPSNQADGSYSFAIRVQDNTGAAGTVISTFVWPTLVTLAPTNFVLVIDDTLDSAYSNRSVNALVSDLQFLYGAGSVQTITAPAAGTGFSGAGLTALQNATAMFWPTDAPFVDTGYTGPVSGNFSLASNQTDPKMSQINAEVAGGLNTHYISGGAFKLNQNAVWVNSPAYLPFPNNTTWYFDGDHGPSTFFGAMATTPNNLAGGGYDTLATGAIATVWREQNFSTHAGATGFMMGYINSTSFPAGAHIGFGSGRVTQMMINYGDLNTTQNGTANKRRLYLENILCKGSASSPWNSPNT